MTDYTLTINLDCVLRDLQITLQRTLDLATFGLYATQAATEPHLGPDGRRDLPGAFMQLRLAPELDFATVREEFRRWVIESGLRDAAEALGLLLEEVRKVLRAAAKGSTVDGEYFQTFVLDEAGKFDGRLFPQKLALIEELGGPAFMPELTPHITSLNQARNCLVHGRGVVRDRDKNTVDGLLVEWVRVGMWIDGEAGQREVIVLSDRTLGEGKFDAGDTISVGWRPTSRLYRVGDRVSFSVQDFSDFCWTFLLFGKQMRKNLEDFVAAKGHSVQTIAAN